MRIRRVLCGLLVWMAACGSESGAEPERESMRGVSTVPPTPSAVAGAAAPALPTAAATNPPPMAAPAGSSGAAKPGANPPPVAMQPPAAGPQPPAMTPPGAVPPPPPAQAPVPMGNGEPRVPAKQGECPKLATGNITVLGQTVRLWVGSKQEGKKGPVFFYWHGTGSTSGEAALLGSALSEIQAEGGIVASFSGSTMKGRASGSNVWYTGDFEMADQILACAVEQLDVDPRRVYTGGCSAGGLQAGSMLYARSSYIAAVMTNSGGTIFPSPLEDPSHVPALITAHGKMGVDVVVVDFSTTSANQTKDIRAKKGFAVNCDHGGGHCGAPPNLVSAQWEFLKAHPFGVKEDPYAAGLPASFPKYCQIIP